MLNILHVGVVLVVLGIGLWVTCKPLRQNSPNNWIWGFPVTVVVVLALGLAWPWQSQHGTLRASGVALKTASSSTTPASHKTSKPKPKATSTPEPTPDPAVAREKAHKARAAARRKAAVARRKMEAAHQLTLMRRKTKYLATRANTWRKKAGWKWKPLKVYSRAIAAANLQQLRKMRTRFRDAYKHAHHSVYLADRHAAKLAREQAAKAAPPVPRNAAPVVHHYTQPVHHGTTVVHTAAPPSYVPRPAPTQAPVQDSGHSKKHSSGGGGYVFTN